MDRTGRQRGGVEIRQDATVFAGVGAVGCGKHLAQHRGDGPRRIDAAPPVDDVVPRHRPVRRPV